MINNANLPLERIFVKPDFFVLLLHVSQTRYSNDIQLSVFSVSVSVNIMEIRYIRYVNFYLDRFEAFAYIHISNIRLLATNNSNNTCNYKIYILLSISNTKCSEL